MVLYPNLSLEKPYVVALFLKKKGVKACNQLWSHIK